MQERFLLYGQRASIEVHRCHPWGNIPWLGRENQKVDPDREPTSSVLAGAGKGAGQVRWSAGRAWWPLHAHRVHRQSREASREVLSDRGMGLWARDRDFLWPMKDEDLPIFRK